MLGEMFTPIESLPDEEETEDSEGTETSLKEDSSASSRKSLSRTPSPASSRKSWSNHLIFHYQHPCHRLPILVLMGKLKIQRLDNLFTKVSKVKE